MEFWDLFDYLCAQKGVSRRKACEDMGFSASLASKGKYAGTRPKTEFIYSCSKYFNVSIDYLMGKEEQDSGIHARQEAFDRAELRVLFDAAKDVPASKIYEVVALLERYKEGSQGK